MATEPNLNFIKQVSIKGLWGDPTKNLEWTLNPDVNILAGGNGTGKTTVLQSILKGYGEFEKYGHIQGYVQIQLNSDTKTKIEENSDYKMSYIFLNDIFLIPKESIQLVMGEDARTSLDFTLYMIIKEYKNYQINLGNKVVEQINKGMNGVKEIYANRELFFDIIDELFSVTKKKIDRTNNELVFINSNSKVINVYQLSSGEKIILNILLYVLVTPNSTTLLLDEPEVSLDTDWQEVLIDKIRLLNPNVQLIIATHSPFIISNGWADPHYIFQIENLFVPETAL